MGLLGDEIAIVSFINLIYEWKTHVLCSPETTLPATYLCLQKLFS